jgi:hypothetical protein
MSLGATTSLQYNKDQLRNAIKEIDLDLLVKILTSNPRWISTELTDRNESNPSLDQVRRGIVSLFVLFSLFPQVPDCGLHPIHIAAAYNKGVEILEWLVEQGVNINSKSAQVRLLFRISPVTTFF